MRYIDRPAASSAREPVPSRFTKAYLDIETDERNAVTVVGLYRPDRGIVQLVGDEISRDALLAALEGVDIIVTYNGSRFDIPVLEKRLGVDLRTRFASLDLMYECWRRRLFGGLKAVERRLGIGRGVADVDGREAMRLWRRHIDENDASALDVLVAYNRDDVLNLVELERKLAEIAERDCCGDGA